MKRNRESGQALVFVAGALVVVLGFLGLGIDIGMLRYQRRQQQSAADSIAIAEAKELSFGTTNFSTGETTNAQNPATSNGYAGATVNTNQTCPTSVTSTTVTVNNPPLSGPHNGDAKYVEACIATLQPTYFMRAFGVNNQVVNARAVATSLAGSGTANGTGCIYTLGTPTAAITANTAGVGSVGSVILNAPTCGIVDNGNMVLNGGTNLNITAGSIGVGGAYSPPGGNATVTPTPVTGMLYSGDPFANAYSAPSAGTSKGDIKITGGSCTGSGCAGNVTCSAGTCTILPGTYNDICIDNNQTVNFSDGGNSTGGLFVITGASTCSANTEFNINAGSTVCNSTNLNCSGMPGSMNGGVTFYLTGSASANVDGTAQVQLAAPNSGTYQGLLFWQAASDTAQMTISGNSNSFYQGLIYAPSAHLVFGGNTGFNNNALYTVLTVDDLDFHGNPDVNLKSNLSGLASGGPLVSALSNATLVE